MCSLLCLDGHMLQCLSHSLQMCSWFMFCDSVCACSWANFTSGFFVGGLAGCGWAYACSQFLPFYY